MRGAAEKGRIETGGNGIGERVWRVVGKVGETDYGKWVSKFCRLYLLPDNDDD